MIKDVSFNNQTLIINTSQGTKEIVLACKIRQAFVFANRLFIRFDAGCFEGTEFYNRNIVCLDEQGKELWKVEDPDWYRSGKERTENPFVGLGLPKDGTMIGVTWDGFHIHIDISTGRLTGDWDYHK